MNDTKTRIFYEKRFKLFLKTEQINLHQKLFKNYFQSQRIRLEFLSHIQKGIQFGGKVNEFDKLFLKNI